MVGLQTSTSWTRENHSNNYLYNAANELNPTTQWYEMFFRGYDPAIGRMLQVDPYASSFASITPYNYALNSPGQINDPSGGYAGTTARPDWNRAYWAQVRSDIRNSPWYDWNTDLGGTVGLGGFYEGGAGGGGGGRGGGWIMTFGNVTVDFNSLPENSQTLILFNNGTAISISQGNFETGSLIIAFMETPGSLSETGWGKVGNAQNLEGAFKIITAFKANGTELKNLILFSHGAGDGSELLFGDDVLKSSQYTLGYTAYAYFNIILDEVSIGGNVLLIGCRAGMETTGIGNVMQHDIRSDVNVYVNQSWSHGREDRDSDTGKLNWQSFYMDSDMLGGNNWWNLQTGQKGLTVIVNSNGTITVK